MKKYVERFGDYYGVTVYHIYQDQHTQEDYHGIGPSLYQKKLKELLKEATYWLSYQSRTLTSQEHLLSPVIRYRPTRYRLSLPARIFDDLLICGLRAKFFLEGTKASGDLRMQYEAKEADLIIGERKPKEIYLNASEWVRIVGIPDSIIDNVVFEFTITRSNIRHLLGRAVIYAYMCMEDGKPCATMIVPVTPGNDLGYLVIPNEKFLSYIVNLLANVIKGNINGNKNPYCASCLYRNICPLF